MPTIDDILIDKATYKPGEAAHVLISILSDDPETVRGKVSLRLVHIDETVHQTEQEFEIEPETALAVAFTLMPPAAAGRGYGLETTLYSESGAVISDYTSAIDVLERWSQAPRYGFLSDFSPEQTPDTVAERCRSLNRYHLNVVQFYDWMWRHYKLVPPPEVEDEFTDFLHRRLSLGATLEAIKWVHARGGAAMAYGAVYGAEPEFADEHPDWRLYDEEGKPISLAELFYIMNIDPSCPWVPLIVSEFGDVIRSLPFDGIHLDQYGFPKTALDAKGQTVDLSVCFPPLIDQARRAVVAENPEAGVIFNAVTNWPIETVAPTTQDVVYIEVWPPYESYNDLRVLISEGKRLSGGKRVILAAYLEPFLEAPDENLPGAEAAAYISTAVIAASGGSHLLLGENEGILCDPYYPKYATMRPRFAKRLRSYYDFLVRYEELLVMPEVADWHADVRGSDGGIALSLEAQAGTVWAIARQAPGYKLLNLVNLRDQADSRWNTLRTQPESTGPFTFSAGDMPPIVGAFAASPNRNMGRPEALSYTQEGSTVTVQIPDLEVWALLAFKVAQA